MSTFQKSSNFNEISPDTLLIVAKDIFITVYPTRMPENSDPKYLSESAGYTRTNQAEHLADEFVDFFNYLAHKLNEV